jgi:hypothetical protein
MEQSGIKELNSSTVPYRALCTALLYTLRTLDIRDNRDLFYVITAMILLLTVSRLA